MLQSLGATVSFYDPYIPVIRPSREHSHWAGTKSIEWTPSQIEKHDVVLITTAHSNIDYQQLVQWAGLIVDTRNATRGLQGRARIVRA
jgi:UDP-N-acetyl-D-glucosamine dehydrogenase